MSDGTRRGLLGLLLAAAIVPYFVGLGDSAIWDANEAFYVETPREMIERGDFVSPTFNYEPRLNKPILSYWIVGGFYRLFGISVGVQRLAIAVGSGVSAGRLRLFAAPLASKPACGRRSDWRSRLGSSCWPGASSSTSTSPSSCL